MSVKIRLSLIGKKHVPFFRIVAVDNRKKRDGAFLDDIGTYDALNSKIVSFKEELMNQWISKGALPTKAVQRIYRLYKKNKAVALDANNPSQKTGTQPIPTQ